MSSKHREKLNQSPAASRKVSGGFLAALYSRVRPRRRRPSCRFACGLRLKGDEQQVSGEPQVITDDSKIVNVTEEFKSVDNPIAVQSAWDLPLGTVPFHSEGAWAALLRRPPALVR